MRFLFVDRILRLDRGREALVRKNVSNSEDFFSDHFAGRPIMPGCLILETCDQVARLLLASGADFTRLPSLIGVTNGKFQHFVVPGDTVEIHAVVTAEQPGGAEVRVAASVEGRRIAQASLAYTFARADEEPAAARACVRMRGFYEMLTAPRTPAAGSSPRELTDQEGRRA